MCKQYGYHHSQKLATQEKHPAQHIHNFVVFLCCVILKKKEFEVNLGFS